MSLYSKRSLFSGIKRAGVLALGFSAWLSVAPFCFAEEGAAEPPEASVEAEASAPTRAARKVSGDELVRLGWTDLSGLRGVLLNGADPNARTRVGDYPIIRLAYGGNVEALEILLDFNARMDVVNVPDNETAKDSLSSLTSFVAEREKMDLKNLSIMTAVMNASPQVTDLQKIRMVQLLLDYGYPVDLYDAWGQTALMSCVQKNLNALARLLVAYGADSDAHNLFNGKTPRDYATTEEMFRILRGRKLYSPTRRPTYGQIKVRLVRPKKYPLLSRVTAPKKILQATRESALHLAVGDGDIETVRQLVADGAQVVTYDLARKTPLHVLCEKQEIPLSAFREIYKIMEQKAGSKILNNRDKQGRIPFHALCLTGREDLVAFLAQQNLKQISTADSDQNTPLHLVATAGETGREVMRFLMLNEAEVDRKNSDGDTPLSLAVKRADAEAFYLLFLGVKVDPVSGISPLVGDSLFALAFRSLSGGRSVKDNAGLIEIMRLLIESGVDVNLTIPENGRNALHYAVAAGSAYAVAFLLKTDVDINKVDLLGKTPLDLALEAKNAGIASLLESSGAHAGKSRYEERRAEREKKAKMTPQERRAERLKKTL